MRHLHSMSVPGYNRLTGPVITSHNHLGSAQPYSRRARTRVLTRSLLLSGCGGGKEALARRLHCLFPRLNRLRDVVVSDLLLVQEVG